MIDVCICVSVSIIIGSPICLFDYIGNLMDKHMTKKDVKNDNVSEKPTNKLQFARQEIDQQIIVSKLTNGLHENSNEKTPNTLVVPPQRRRSSVLRRMSVGYQVDSYVKDDIRKILKIDIHRSNNNGEKLGQDLTEDVLEEDDSDQDGELARHVARSDHTAELYKRSNSKTPACQISDFEPIKVLGQGAYGKVILVKSRKNGKLFAQKELKKASIIVNSRNVERTISERTILSKVTSHQNIVKLFYALHDRSKLYLLMEYIPGGELFKYLVEEKFLNEKKTSFYISQMSMALKFLHDFGIVYRDLKPENCMLDKDGYLILTDFGLAKKAYDDAADDDICNSGHVGENWCNSVIGTPEYCAPEVLKGNDYGARADWWSLGCVTFDLLTGDPPFTGNNHKRIMDRVLKEKPKYPFYITTTSKEFLNKLLVKNPDKRLDVDGEWAKFQKLQFFRHYRFQDVEQRKVEPPIRPSISDPELAENFDPTFTSMKLSDLNINGVDIAVKSGESELDDCFAGFSYTASNSFVENYL